MTTTVRTIVCLAWAMSICPGTLGGTSDETEPASARVVHRFDFDERAAGNLEDIPRYWLPLRPPGFPRFAVGEFDFEVGRAAPPSFYLGCNGRQVAYQYNGPETRVRANSAYRIEAFVRPDRLVSARACLSAHFLDKHGRILLDTMVRSQHVGGASGPSGWSRLELYLPAAPKEAARVGLVAWILQEPLWDTAALPKWHIPRVDVQAGAWFDDITIHALPQVELGTSAPGNVLTADGPQELRIVLADNESEGLTGLLKIRAADGDLVERRSLVVVTEEHVEPTVIPVDHLDPGLYVAQLQVLSGDTEVISRSLAFARLAPSYRVGDGNARPFGVVVEPGSRSDSETELNLLQRQTVRSVKLPVWTGLAQDPPTPAQRRAADHLIQELVREGFALTGVFYGSPSAIMRNAGPYPRPLLDLLSDKPSLWQEHMAAVVAPNAGTFRWWQVGPDGPDGPVNTEKLSTAVGRLREAMSRFITVPQLSTSAAMSVEPASEKLPVEQITLAAGAEIPPGWLASQLARFAEQGYDRVSLYIEPLSAQEYRRVPRLADWARRILTARFAGVDTIFVPQTWHVRDTAFGRVTEPTEEFIVLRTIADVIADTIPAQHVRLGSGIECFAFREGDSVILAVWDAQAPPEGRKFPVQLGQAQRQIDLWGRSTRLHHDEHGRQILHLSSAPIFVDGIERWLIDLRTSLNIRPDKIESGTELAHHQVEFAYYGSKPVSGDVFLDAPEPWEVSPRALSFAIMPQRTETLPIQVRYPHNEVAGVRDVVAKLSLSSDDYYLEVPLSIEIGLEAVEVSGLAVIEGTDLVVRHTLTNRSDEVIHFRGAAQVSGRQRQYRPFSNLQPGDTQTAVYRFANAQNLAGSTVRVGLREMNDGPRTHTLELTVP